MAQGDQIGRPFGGHDSSQPGDFQHVALSGLAVADQLGRCRLHRHLAAGPRPPNGNRFLPNIDHPAGTVRVKMGKMIHDSEP